jgi:hypothetical protein
MSEQGPPASEPTDEPTGQAGTPAGTQPEYLEPGGGAPWSAPDTVPDAQHTGGGRSRRTAWLVGGGVVGLLALGVGAYAAISFFRQGEQPAVALPAGTLGYVSVDLDPSGGQKIDAFRTLDKFPAFKDQVGIHTVDDVRRTLGESILRDNTCGLTYDKDVAPWLGDRLAAAAVDLGNPKPATVLVLQVTDDGKAQTAIKRIDTCETSSGHGGYVVHDGWAVITDTQAEADQVEQDAQQSSLADDPTYQRWTKAVGDAGVVNAYAAPAAGRYLAARFDRMSRLFSDLGPLGGTGSAGSSAYSSQLTTSAYHSTAPSGVAQALRDFKGAAATLRFTGNGLELATASDAALAGSGVTSDQGGAVVSGLPDDTAVAVGLGLQPGWLTHELDQFRMFGGGQTRQQVFSEIEKETGLSVPDDIETLLGSSTALSIGHGFDLEAATNSGDGSGLPVAITVKGDPTAIEQVLDKVRAKQPAAASALGSDSQGDLVAVGPTESYRQQVLAGGHLGDTEAFRSVVPEADHAGALLFVNVDELQPAISQLAAGDSDITSNITPLKAIGLSTWVDGDVAHASFEISTD